MLEDLWKTAVCIEACGEYAGEWSRHSNKNGPDHIPLPLHWWLWVGIGFIAIVMTYKLARRRRLMRTACKLFGLLAGHLRPDSSSSPLLAENGTSTRDFGHSEPTRAGLSANVVTSNDLAARKVSKATASGYGQGKLLHRIVPPVPPSWTLQSLPVRIQWDKLPPSLSEHRGTENTLPPV